MSKLHFSLFRDKIPRPSGTPFLRGKGDTPPYKGGAEEQPVPILREGGGFLQRLSPEKGVFLSAIFVSIILFQSCRPDFTAETRAVDSLLGVVAQVENASAEVDPRLIRQYMKDIEQRCSKIQNELTDTVALDQAQVLVRFCSLQEHLSNCLGRKEKIDEEIVATRNQLFNLRTDLTQKVTDKDSVNQYIESEFLYVEGLDEGMEQIVAELNGCFATYSELKEEIDDLLISLPSRAGVD